MNLPVVILLLATIAVAALWLVVNAIVGGLLGFFLWLLGRRDTQQDGGDSIAHGDWPHVPTIEIPSFHNVGE